ncbi:MAG: TIGR02757 family protein [Flavobacteriales bacterium]|nr:TIGR02757 family protein [Flavobacteriales bacterium]
MRIKHSEQLFDLLEAKYIQYNRFEFIEDDPISIPHQFSKKEDIEIAGFLAATIAWGQRKTIITNANKMLQIMDYAPHDFILNHTEKDLPRTEGFVHRTFNSSDLNYFFTALQNIYTLHGGLEKAFLLHEKTEHAVSLFKQLFFSFNHGKRTQKHVADPIKKSTAKRINMYLRWTVRQDIMGVDFGIWKNHAPANLMLPLDVHTGNVGRSLGLLNRKQNDWQAVEELTSALRIYDAKDPVKYDFALFGIGVNKELV